MPHPELRILLFDMTSIRLAALGSFAACLAIGACGDNLVAPAPEVAIALRIYPTGNFAFNVGEPFLFTATLIASDSTELGSATSATWISSDTSIATITTDGHFRARCAGYTIIRATQSDGSRILSGQRTVPVNTTGPHCAAPSISTQTPNER